MKPAIFLLSLILSFSGFGQKKSKASNHDFFQTMFPFFSNSKNLFGFQHQSSMKDTGNNIGPLIFLGSFIDHSKKGYGGKIKVDDVMEILPDGKGQYNYVTQERALAGRNHTFFIEAPSAGSNPISFTDTLYFPQLLKIYEPPPSNISEENIIDIGTLFTRSPDLQNPSGEISIGVEFNPSDMENRKEQKSKKTVRNALIQKTTGHLKLQSHCLKTFRRVPLLL